MGLEPPPCVIFALFCLLVPIFMAYNGGATAATVDTIQHEEKWSPAGIGLLGSMDKIGMTMAAAFWGYMLQRYSSKFLLCIGLLVNSASTMAFGTLRNPTGMCLAKLLIGFTESLQWVWAPLWIGKWATADSLPIWMNLSGGGVSSGVGNGLGTIIAGYTTAQGFSYEFAFQIEASVLFLLSLPLLVTSEDMLIYRDDTAPPVKIRSPVKRVVRLSDGSLDEHLVDAAGQPSQPSVGRPAPKETLASQLGQLWGNPLFCRCAMAYASANYVNSALQFLWVRVFMELWDMDKDYCVTSFLIISASSGALGILAASCQKVDRDHAGKLSTLRFVHKAFSGAVLGALVVVVGVMPQLHRPEASSLEQRSLLTTWLGLSLVLVGVTAVPGMLQILCIESVEDPELRSFATGLAQGANNFLGFAMGPMVPQLMMDFLECHLGWGHEKALVSALVTALLGTSMGALCTTLAVAAVDFCSVPESDLEGETDSTSISHVSGSEGECSSRSFPEPVGNYRN